MYTMMITSLIQIPIFEEAKMKRKVLLGVISVILASVCYGITPILSNAALDGGLPADFVVKAFGESALSMLAADESRALSNESVVGISMGIACILSLINCFVMGKRILVSSKQFSQLCLMGGFAFAATCMLISFAYLFIPAGMTIVLHFTYPVFVVLASMLFFKEKVTPVKLVSLAAAMIGIALISHSSFGGSVNLVGVMLALFSGLTYAAYFLAGRNASYSKLDTPVSNTYITGSACVFCLIIGIIGGKLSMPSDWFIWLILFLEALLGYTIGLQLLLNGIRLIGSTAASALNTLEPAFASITSMIVLGETMGVIKGMGVLLVLFAALVSIIMMKKKEEKADIT